LIFGEVFGEICGIVLKIWGQKGFRRLKLLEESITAEDHCGIDPPVGLASDMLVSFNINCGLCIKGKDGIVKFSLWGSPSQKAPLSLPITLTLPVHLEIPTSVIKFCTVVSENTPIGDELRVGVFSRKYAHLISN